LQKLADAIYRVYLNAGYLYGNYKDKFMSYAIIETGGKQVRVEPGRFYDIELLPVEPEASIIIESVLLVQHDGEVTIGQPFIEGATVEGTVMRHFRGRKVIVYKMQPKKKTRKKRGHRQEITRLMINSISMNGSAIASYSAQQDETAVTDQTTAEASPTEETAEAASE
jgi:large subunit ribosomal protein L21